RTHHHFDVVLHHRVEVLISWNDNFFEAVEVNRPFPNDEGRLLAGLLDCGDDDIPNPFFLIPLQRLAGAYQKADTWIMVNKLSDAVPGIVREQRCCRGVCYSYTFRFVLSGEGRRNMDIVELKNGPDSAAICLRGEPREVLHIPREFGIRKHLRFRKPGQLQEVRERVSGPEIDRVEAVLGKQIEITEHQSPVEEPGKILWGQWPVITQASGFHPEKIGTSKPESGAFCQTDLLGKLPGPLNLARQFEAAVH